MNSNSYILIFVTILTASVAVLLTGLREVTKEKAAQNEDIFNKRAILSAMQPKLDKEVKKMTDEEVLELFKPEVMDQVVLNMQGEKLNNEMAENIDMAKERKKPEPSRKLPLYIYKGGQEPIYILSIRGSGLWDEIWGNIALQDDLNTIVGAAFDHKQETPGLGAEIKDNPNFSKQFQGKEIYEGSKYVGITVRKGGAKDPDHEVDGISGATVTSDGVTDMIYNGIKNYEPYFATLKSSSMLKN